jgi:hypothetical protein
MMNIKGSSNLIIISMLGIRIYLLMSINLPLHIIARVNYRGTGNDML